MLDTSSQLRFPLPLAAASQLFTMAASKGWGALDDAAVARYTKRYPISTYPTAQPNR